VDGIAKEGKASFDKIRIPLIITAVICFILSPIGVIVTGILEAMDFVIICMIAFLLIMVACGVGIFIYTSRINGIYTKLLKEDILTPEQRKKRRITSKLSGTYWCLVVAFFMVMGLALNKWEMAGIIFPVAGVVYAAIIGIIKVIVNDD